MYAPVEKTKNEGGRARISFSQHIREKHSSLQLLGQRQAENCFCLR